MDITLRLEHRDALVIVLDGDLDIDSARSVDAYTEAAIESAIRNVVLDLSQVSFIDCQGLNALLRAHRLAGSVGGRLSLRSPSRSVRFLLEVSGCAAVLGTESRTCARRSTNAQRPPPLAPSRPRR